MVNWHIIQRGVGNLFIEIHTELFCDILTELSWLKFLVRYDFCCLMATYYSGILRWCKESSELYIFMYK